MNDVVRHNRCTCVLIFSDKDAASDAPRRNQGEKPVS